VTYGLIFELRSFLAENYPEYVSMFSMRIWNIIAKVEQDLPRYENQL
jgi:hypothetical protein